MNLPRCAVFLFAALAPLPNNNNTEEELKKIQGTWHVVAVAWQEEPHKYPLDGNGKIDVIIDKDRLRTVSMRGDSMRFKIKRMSGGQIDLIRDKIPEEDFVYQGIYSLEGDNLKICYSVGERRPKSKLPQRPTDYKSPKDSLYYVLFLKRQKEKE